MKTVIDSNISRLVLHDSSIESFVRHGQKIELVFDWSKFENFIELDISEVIIIGKTTLLLSGVNSEELRIYDDNENFSIIPFSEDIINNLYIISSNEIDDIKKTVKISALYKLKEEYKMVEWTFKFDGCKVSWDSFVTGKEWLDGKLPKD